MKSTKKQISKFYENKKALKLCDSMLHLFYCNTDLTGNQFDMMESRIADGCILMYEKFGVEGVEELENNFPNKIISDAKKRGIQNFKLKK